MKFCILSLYPMILINSFISSNSFFFFLVNLLGFSMFKVLVEAKRDNFFFSPIWLTLLAFSCLPASARASSTMLNRTGKRRYHCLVINLRVKTLSFTIKYNVSCMFFIDALYHVEEVPS